MVWDYLANEANAGAGGGGGGRRYFSNVNDILFLVRLPCISLHYMLVPVQYREHEYGLLLRQIHIIGSFSKRKPMIVKNVDVNFSPEI